MSSVLKQTVALVVVVALVVGAWLGFRWLSERQATQFDALFESSIGLYPGSDVQMLGVGIAVAIVVDATVIRAVLVPAFMRLAGAANWWAPPGMRRWAVRPSGPNAAADSAGHSDEDLRSVMG